MKSLVIGEDNKNYGAIRSTDKKNISHLSAAVSKKTPLCYSKVNPVCMLKHPNKTREQSFRMEYIQTFPQTTSADLNERKSINFVY